MMKTRQQLKPLALAASVTVLALMTVLPLSGCGAGNRLFGGSGGSGTTRKVGTMTFRVTWPKQSRLVPIASNAIRVTVTRNGAVVSSKTVVKPADFSDATPPSTVTFDNLEVGDSASAVPADQVFTYTITATAFPVDPITNPTAVPQASGTVDVGLSTEDPSKTVGLTMASTIKSVVISSPILGTNLGPNRTMTLTATAYDGTNGTGNVVLTTANKWKWSQSAVVGGNLSGEFGNPVDFTGASVDDAVTTTVTVEETESGIKATTDLVTVPVGLGTGPWPRFHGSNQNSGIATDAAPINTTPSVVAGWETASVGAAVEFSSPVVAKNGDVYVGALNGRLYAFASNGSVKWSFQTGGAIQSTPLIGKDGTVYIGSSDGFMYAIQDLGTSGRRAWAYKTAGPVTSSPVIDKGGYLYFASSDTDNRVIGVDALSGTAKKTPAGTPWVFTASAGIQGGLALSSDETSVVLGDVNGNVYSVNTSTATANWTYSTGSVVYSAAPLITTIGGQAAVVVGTTEGKLHAISLTSGTSVWADAVDLEGQIYSSAAVSPDGTTIYVATFDNTSGLDRSRVLAINAADGTHKWNTAAMPSFNPGFTSSPVVSFDGSKLYIGCYDGKLYGVNTTDGSVAWAYAPTAPGEYFDSSPAIGADGTLYIGGVSGTFYAVK